MSSSTRPGSHVRRAVAIAALLLAAFALAKWVGVDEHLSLDALKTGAAGLSSWIERHWLAASALFFVAYVTMAALSIPGATVLTLAAGALFGLVQGTVLVSFASTIGATLAFLVARYGFRDLVRERFGDRLREIDAGLEKDGAFYLLSLRLLPAVPFFVVNRLAGVTSLRTHTFYVLSQLGMLPATIVYVAAGTQLARIESLRDVLSPGLLGALIALGLLPLALKMLVGWIRRRRADPGFRRPASFDYNLVAIGAGSAGLVTGYIGAAVKAKVAIIERHRMGGDCLNTGCVPSKALIRSARLLAEARNSQRYGIRSMTADFDFAEVMERVQSVIKKIEPHDSVERYTGLGVDVIRGEARLVSPWEIEVEGRRISARSIVIATGARPLEPRDVGHERIDALTSDTVWSLRKLPQRLLVLGGGPIGCELAQCFARFGTQVRIVEMAPRLLPREDADVSAELLRHLHADGVEVATGHRATRFEDSQDGQGGALLCDVEDEQVRFEFDRVLLALGRTPNTQGLGLEALGVELGPRGHVAADGWLRTSLPNILVAGDVAGPYQFTHTAAHQAWYAAINGLLAPFWKVKADYRVIPWVTFTDPEVARVGLSEEEARAQEVAVEITCYGIDDLDRAIADGSDHGFVKVLTAAGTDRIVGACIVGPHAGELLPEFVLAMKYKLGLNKLLGTIHVYPTLNEANKYAAGAWKRAHAPAGALRMARRFFAWRRE